MSEHKKCAYEDNKQAITFSILILFLGILALIFMMILLFMKDPKDRIFKLSMDRPSVHVHQYYDGIEVENNENIVEDDDDQADFEFEEVKKG